MGGLENSYLKNNTFFFVEIILIFCLRSTQKNHVGTYFLLLTYLKFKFVYENFEIFTYLRKIFQLSQLLRLFLNTFYKITELSRWVVGMLIIQYSRKC